MATKRTSKNSSANLGFKFKLRVENESNPTTRRLAVMNLALRGIEADFSPEHADTFRHDPHPYVRLSRHGKTTPNANCVIYSSKAYG